MRIITPFATNPSDAFPIHLVLAPEAPMSAEDLSPPI
jgi:hypothetical protein